MNSIAKRLMAVFAVFAMIAAPAVAILNDGQDSSATEIDCSKYYYNQLDSDLARNVYNKMAAATSFNESFSVELTDADKTKKAAENPDNYNRDEVSKAAPEKSSNGLRVMLAVSPSVYVHWRKK